MGNSAFWIEANRLVEFCDSRVIVAGLELFIALADQNRVACSRFDFGLFALFGRRESSESLLLGLRTLAPSFRLGRRSCLAFLLGFKSRHPSLFGFRTLALRLRLDSRACPALRLRLKNYHRSLLGLNLALSFRLGPSLNMASLSHLCPRRPN